MKRSFIAVLLFALVLTSTRTRANHYCLVSDPVSSVDVPIAMSEPCKVYMVNIYLHYIYGHPNASAYSTSLNNTILNNLNSTFNSYGIAFRISGSRMWSHSMFSDPASFPFMLQGIGDDPGAQVQSNAINIYVLPANSQIMGGYVPANNKKVLLIGGTRVVPHCVGGTKTYEIAKTKVVSHEMGHCFGLVHTHQTNGDDGLADTSIDYVTKNECVNPTSCQFVPNCGSCNVASNPTTTMNNIMSYTVPNCMTVFSPMQLDLMRVNLNNSMAAVVHKSETTPNLQLMTYDNNKMVYTVNSVVAGTHYIYTNLEPLMLSNNISWSTNVGQVFPTGTKNINATISINTGQSMTVSLAATNICGTSTRNPAFTTSGGGWYFSTSTNSRNSVAVVFDDIENPERLPRYIAVYNSNGMEEARIDVHHAWANGQFRGNTLEISSDRLTPGIKFIKTYQISSSRRGQFAKTERIYIPQ